MVDATSLRTPCDSVGLGVDHHRSIAVGAMALAAADGDDSMDMDDRDSATRQACLCDDGGDGGGGDDHHAAAPARRTAPHVTRSEAGDSDAVKNSEQKGDLMSAMLPIEILVLIYGHVHRDELEAAAIARWSGYWDRGLGGDTDDDNERGGPPGVYRLLTLSRAHHEAVASTLADWRAWPDSCYGPGAAIWVPGIACTGPSEQRHKQELQLASHEDATLCKPCDHAGHDDYREATDDIDVLLCQSSDRAWSPRERPTTWLHPVLADRRLHGLWLGAGLHMPPCWLGTPARHLLATASRLADESTPADAPLRRRWLAALRDLLAAPSWPAPCLVLRVQVPHACDFAHEWAHRLPVLTLTRTYFCAPGSAARSAFSVGSVVDAIADFYTGTPLEIGEMERIRAHARSVWRTYERHYGRAWDPYDFAPGGGARLRLDEDDGDNDDSEMGRERYAADGEPNPFTVGMTVDARPGRVLYGRDPYRGGWGRRRDTYESRFESWFVDRWLGEGDLPPSERVLARQFADPDRYGRPCLCDLAPPPTHDDPPPRLAVERFGYGRRRGVRQLTVGFAHAPDQ
ncbi:hypothetical protein pkur_cds_585 [Pandoravirus kuranda]|uniref:Uncharacterized protein n=1 Tax=Pandoravirus kuranda TaxID=3019033 RepID=A0AA95J2C0_9VIRU|nr:hypothetical protein pkur_cds_585 [Pandoravirus kuranda]